MNQGQIRFKANASSNNVSQLPGASDKKQIRIPIDSSKWTANQTTPRTRFLYVGDHPASSFRWRIQTIKCPINAAMMRTSAAFIHSLSIRASTAERLSAAIARATPQRLQIESNTAILARRSIGFKPMRPSRPGDDCRMIDAARLATAARRGG